LVDALVEQGLLSALEWHAVCSSTNAMAAKAAARGVREIYAVVAGEQTAGRGRLGRAWHAPPGTSLTCSLVLRPPAASAVLSLLPLLTGLALVEAVEILRPGTDAALKWPNDLLLEGRKAAGILVESACEGAVIIGIGVNVDWRGVERPPGRPDAISIAEATGCDVDRWDVLATLLGTFTARYRGWHLQPSGFLADYTQRCATLGRTVRVTTVRGSVVSGRADAIDHDGALVIGLPDSHTVRVTAGDVEHVR
jgi:BirA family biotin operon repressor/biotin-[acetyl-CoA-carboxylase] ligase